MDVAIAANRDRAIVDFVGRYGVVSTPHVTQALGLAPRTAQRRIAACIEGRLLDRFRVLAGEPSLLCATSGGLRYAGLRLKPATVRLASLEHRLRCASTAQLLVQEFDPSQILSERQLIYAERLAAKSLFSAPLPNSQLHRPDLVVLPSPASSDLPSLHSGDAKHARTRKQAREHSGGDERELVRAEEMRLKLIAIEVELSAKNPQRLTAIMRAWQQATHISEVRYYAKPGPTARAVERAISKASATDRIHLYEAPPRLPAYPVLPEYRPSVSESMMGGQGERTAAQLCAVSAEASTFVAPIRVQQAVGLLATDRRQIFGAKSLL